MIHDRPANDVIPDECYENTSADINEYRALVASTPSSRQRLLLGIAFFSKWVALIFIFFIALLGYRFVAGRLFSK